jgi:hypothetical protein
VASILASAGVALVTTLLVEYLAKPSLEVRKDRILETNRDKRKAIKGIWQVHCLLGELQLNKKHAPFEIPKEYLENTGNLASGVVRSLRLHSDGASAPLQVRRPGVLTIDPFGSREVGNVGSHKAHCQSGSQSAGRADESLRVPKGQQISVFEFMRSIFF